jgi:RNA-splicing ligase RtcB
MLKLQGSVVACTVMADEVDANTRIQLERMLNCAAFSGSTICIMPDFHAGAGAVIGLTATVTDRIIPNVIGVDIGCGVSSCELAGTDEIDFKAFDDWVRAKIPSGFAVRSTPDPAVHALRDLFAKTCEVTEQSLDYTLRSCGTLGGGNHFIELGKDETGRCWLTVHSGSRGFGFRVACYYQSRARALCGDQGGLEWLEGADASEYLYHMDVARDFAALNRQLIMRDLGLFFPGGVTGAMVASEHNYIATHAPGVYMIRKGAISARLGEPVVIPGNMRDGIILGRGLGNPEWNYSAPHGAGRALRCGDAVKQLSLDDFKTTMHGVWSSCISTATLAESPMAYKDFSMIADAISPTVEIVHRIKPIYNFKAGRIRKPKTGQPTATTSGAPEV